jgi:hypothetical protein
VVGLGRLELPTSRLSSARSNQLSYKPLTLIFPSMLVRKARIGVLLTAIGQAPCRASRMYLHKRKALRQRVRPRRKRNEDGEIPPMELDNPGIAGP